MSPIPVYVVAGAYAVTRSITCVTALLREAPVDPYRNSLMDITLSLLECLIMIALLVVMTYTLHRKRKLSMK